MIIGTWFYGTGKKKTSVAKVFIKKGKGEIVINGKKPVRFFKRKKLISNIYEPINITKEYNIDLYIKITGGGESSKSVSIMYGISKALSEYNIEFKNILKKNKLLSVDNRKVERKKYGRVKARKSKQYSKR